MKKKAISEGHGDTALVLLKAGAEVDKVDVDGNLAIDLAPDTKVCMLLLSHENTFVSLWKVRTDRNSLD